MLNGEIVPAMSGGEAVVAAVVLMLLFAGIGRLFRRKSKPVK